MSVSSATATLERPQVRESDEGASSQARLAAAARYGWLALALALGALCRFWHLTAPSLFIDEGFTFHISSYDPKSLLHAVAYTDFHPPLFYLATHYLMGWLHWQPWDYRYSTAACGLVTIAATWGIARMLFGTTAAAIAALFVALEPNLIVWDRLYRMYAILVALTTLSWWLLLKAEASELRRRWFFWAAYWLCAVLLPYVQYLGAVAVLSQSLYALAHRRRCWPALIGGVAALAALVPWFWAIRVQYPHGGLVLPLTSPRFSWPVLVRAIITSGIPAAWVLSAHFDQIFCAIVLAIAAAGVYLGRKTALAFWLLPVLIQLVVTITTGKDIVIPRHLYAYLPAFAVCLALVCVRLFATKWRVAGAALALSFFAMSAVSIPNNLFVQYYQFPDWYAINTLLLARAHKTDLIILDQGAEYWVVHDFSGFRGHQIDAPGIPSDIPPDVRWLEGYPKRRVWYIENQPFFTDAGRHIQADLERTRPRVGAWIQPRIFDEDVVRVVLYGPRFGARGLTKSVVKTTSP